MVKKEVLDKISDYYTDKILEHGATPEGVDWNGEESQNKRFEQTSKIIGTKGKFSILDIGCGYGAYFNVLKENYSNFEYTGFDISKEMIESAKSLHTAEDANWIMNLEKGVKYDYVVSSGIFNVRLEETKESWLDFVDSQLQIHDQYSTKGFSCNFLTSYSDSHKMRDYLHYEEPFRVFDICKKVYSKDLAILHDYGLCEFTLIVRK